MKSKDEIENEDTLRQEAFQLYQEFDQLSLNTVFTSSKKQIQEMIQRAKRVLEIRTSLTFKLVNQLDILESLFSLYMVAEDYEKAQDVAELGEKLSVIRFNKGRCVEEWSARRKDPIAYLIG